MQGGMLTETDEGGSTVAATAATGGGGEGKKDEEEEVRGRAGEEEREVVVVVVVESVTKCAVPRLFGADECTGLTERGGAGAVRVPSVILLL